MTRGGATVAVALSPRVASTLVGILTGTRATGSTYSVRGKTGIYRNSQTRVVAQGTSATTAATIVSLLNRRYTASHRK